MDSSSSSSTSAATLSYPIHSLSKQILRLRCKPKKDSGTSSCSSSSLDDEKTTTDINTTKHILPITGKSDESLLGKASAGVSSVTAAYARLQYAESPYDPEAVHSSDGTIVAHLEQLSHLKHCFLGGSSFSHESRVSAEIQEQRNATFAFDIAIRNMESTLHKKTRQLSSLGDSDGIKLGRQ